MYKDLPAARIIRRALSRPRRLYVIAHGAVETSFDYFYAPYVSYKGQRGIIIIRERRD